jgi:aspartyl/glutamyl-tRNA(Asn/Gln) amidotransferase C subunit
VSWSLESLLTPAADEPALTLTSTEIEHLHWLSHLSATESASTKTDISLMLHFARKIKDSNVQSDSIKNSVPAYLNLRDDSLKEIEPVDSILKNATITKGYYFAVPQVLE